MRGALVDRSLTAIAGPPALDVTVPTRRFTIDAGHTLIAVGRYTYDPEQIATGQGLIIWRDDTNGVTPAYTYARLPEGSFLTSMPTSQYGVLSGVHWAYGWHPGPESIGVGLGAHNSFLSYDWRGDFRGLVYDHALSVQQIMAMVRKLSRRLADMAPPPRRFSCFQVAVAA